MPKYYPNPICSDCADKIGGRMPEGHICGWWESECDVCKEVKSVTAARDWRYPSIDIPKSQIPNQ